MGSVYHLSNVKTDTPAMFFSVAKECISPTEVEENDYAHQSRAISAPVCAD